MPRPTLKAKPANFKTAPETPALAPHPPGRLTPGSFPFTADDLRAISPAGRDALLAVLSLEEREELKYLWEFWARPDQLTPPGDWFIWLLLAGRGFGKTRVGAESVRRWAETAATEHIALVGPTIDEVRSIMVEGESGILGCCPAWNKPKYEPSKRQITWPNGVKAYTYSADEPERLRGHQQGRAWLDEICAWTYMQESYDQVVFGTRLSSRPQIVVSTTPKPSKLLKRLVDRANPKLNPTPDVVMTRGSTLANKANLPPRFITEVFARYGGTRQGRQELEAAILDDTPGALWTEAILETSRRKTIDGAGIYRIVIGVDPAGRIADMARVAAGLPVLGGAVKGGDECGIVVAGKADDDDVYVLADVSAAGNPQEWGGAVVDAYIKWSADVVVVEYNHGGETAEQVIQAVAKDRGVNVNTQQVWASKGKYTRAEPIATPFIQDRAHLLGLFNDLEDEMTTFVPGAPSPNRLDAMVFALTHLLGGLDPGGAVSGGRRDADVSMFGGGYGGMYGGGY